ncbi:MAG: hypothetical protein GOMPHAMPRED_005825 [Gomphillus americanus]|uniref:Uncharacterized protein n=1 Tax=Gomphillus americanus TaxID=1940652 RepID=A0A8H3IRZ2_9LECA|nr:MAG: hypothetical protein GOMPHAMPRED_005825 [Gomphillus americanus]
MAPIEPDLTNSNTRSILAGATYLTTTATLVALIGYRVFYRAYISLPPSQYTRIREHSRKYSVDVFAGLAAVSLGIALYYGYQFLLLSYQIWAYERGEIIPTGLTTEEGLLSASGPRLFLGRWFHDTDLTGEFWEIAMEKTRRRWWTNQLLVSTAAWSSYVSVQGRARGIPHLWAFVALAPLTSLAFAMNLFFVAVLLTPTPIPSDATALAPTSPKRHGRKVSTSVKSAAANTAIRADTFLGRLVATRDHYLPPKPSNWTPAPLVSLIPLVLTVVHTTLLSFASNTTAFHSLLNLLLVDVFLPVLLPVVLPRSWGSTTTTHHHHTKSLTAFSILSLGLHIFTTFIAIIYNDPGAHRHRHSVLFFRKDSDRSQAARTATAFGKIAGAIFDHPAVGRIGSDVLLVSITLATWAAVRGLDPRQILRAAGWASKSELERAAQVKNLVVQEVQSLMHSAVNDNEDTLPETPSPRRSAKKSTAAKKIEDGEAPGEKGAGARSFPESAVAVRGEDEAEIDWESGALAWGMMVLGGLGCGVAGVLGADIGL